MTSVELNELATNTMKNLSEHSYFNNLTIYDQQISDNVDPFNKGFYMSIQDKINLINGELITSYYELRAELKTYIAVRKHQIILEKTQKEEKVPGNEILESLILAEVPQLNTATIVLEGWTVRADSSLKTARNHTYETKEVTKGQD
jgi:hypothetical protein